MEWIDLRSDTVTLPTPKMREAIANAELGDDVFGEDPTVNRLQSMAAEMLGMEDALFVPSGTMGNLTGILAHCGRGDEAIVGDQSHTFFYEAGGMSVLGGVHPHPVPNQPDGTMSLEAIEEAIRPTDNPHYPISRLIVIENTHNRCGGAPLTPEYTRNVGDLAKARGLRLHIDGARIFNAAAAFGVQVQELTAPADSVMFCLSKGLCAPVGSLICGSEEFIRRAHRIRKVLGGGMRQAGVLAAAGVVALQTMVERVEEDHQKARKLAEGIKGLPGLDLKADFPVTNMVLLNLTSDSALNALQLKDALWEKRIKVVPRAERTMRLVVHYWIDDQAIERVIDEFQRLFGNA
jgi:threonine aldolase